MSFEDRLQNGEFCIPECDTCKKTVWPPSEFCSHCLGTVHLRDADNSMRGTIIEFSGKDDTYFCMVEFAGSIRVLSHMTVTPQIGQTVKISKCGIRDGNYFFKVTGIL